MTTLPQPRDPLPPRFEVKQALYTSTGKKIGWVKAIRSPFEQRPDLDVAEVEPIHGGSVLCISALDLADGKVLRRSDLKLRRIPRQTPMTVPIGARLFDTQFTMYRGTVTKVFSHPMDPEDFACSTTIGTMVTASEIRAKKITIGRRTHNDSTRTNEEVAATGSEGPF